ncbi:MAG: sigma-54 dependent transcriptional regulator [Mariprofundaceae bacterium]|nr:sigma-54 dependent transcriptional regulator [Mariprofundaceae bacterium]
MADILLVEDEDNARQVLSLGLETMGHWVTACSGVEEADVALSSDCSFDVVLTDLRMDGRDGGLDVVRMASERCPRASVLLLTAYASAETAVEAMREGAFDYLTKPVSSEELGDAVERALAANISRQADDGTLEEAQKKEKKASKSYVKEPAGDIAREDLLVARSNVMQRVKERLLRAARRDFTVLISGESGTGKELAARFVHAHSDRYQQPFVPVHCGAIPEGLFESELFGHRKGAFTSADAHRTGLIESAHGGTLFLDEIGEMPLSIQVKLLRVLQEKSFRPVGADQEKPANIRIVAATNRDLADEVKHERFREDLFYRLNVVPVHMPALRQRREDIPDLVRVLIERTGAGVNVPAGCVERLMQLPLRGNVRELENLLQRLIALSDDDTLDVSLLDDFCTMSDSSGISLDKIQREGSNLDKLLEGIERQLLSEALTETNGNATQAAKLLGVSFRSIRYRMKKLGMKGD